ncbi:MAG TPA: hypothetical protein PLF41_09995, partial [Anaerolineales bacterium]|nr:hypothetical protein [Anaerolineales bacterium]
QQDDLFSIGELGGVGECGAFFFWCEAGGCGLDTPLASARGYSTTARILRVFQFHLAGKFN